MNDTLKSKALVVGILVTIAAIAIAAICVFGWLKHSETQRYYMVPSKDGVTYKIDRKTGRTWSMRGGRVEEVKTPNPKPSTHELPGYVTAEITGRGGYYSFTSLFTGNLYNPTDYHIKSITFIIQNEKTGSQKWRRKFTDAVNISPKSTGSFQFDTIDGDTAGANDWSIESVSGHVIN